MGKDYELWLNKGEKISPLKTLLANTIIIPTAPYP